MQQQTSATLTTIFSEVLANLAFMFTDEEQVNPSSTDAWLETVISYQGPVNGTLRFRCTTDFSVLLASNLLGVDLRDAEAGAKARDAVKEFMNIVCGQFVTALHGSESIFNLTIPEITELAETPDLRADNGVDSSTLSVDGFLVQLSYLPAGENALTD
ncbi:MAG TPA: chemotaxis protein CheX [Phycisphaerae bacterium]|nr:chemotaxis protein CheX [Phycisphaerae bacterium]